MCACTSYWRTICPILLFQDIQVFAATSNIRIDWRACCKSQTLLRSISDYDIKCFHVVQDFLHHADTIPYFSKHMDIYWQYYRRLERSNFIWTPEARHERHLLECFLLHLNNCDYDRLRGHYTVKRKRIAVCYAAWICWHLDFLSYIWKHKQCKERTRLERLYLKTSC